MVRPEVVEADVIASGPDALYELLKVLRVIQPAPAACILSVLLGSIQASLPHASPVQTGACLSYYVP